jgi:hypothetical protein
MGDCEEEDCKAVLAWTTRGVHNCGGKLGVDKFLSESNLERLFQINRFGKVDRG